MRKTIFSCFSKKTLAAILSMILVITSISAAMLTAGAEGVETVINGGFEDGVTGYKTSNLTYEIVNATESPENVHSGEKAVMVQGKGTSGQQCNLYQKIIVQANTDYEWKFWFKAAGSAQSLVGVRDENGDYLMPSSLSTDGGGIYADRRSFDSKRDTTTANWHTGMDTAEWKEYIVKFNSGDQTAVWLTLNLFTETRVGYTDDWSISKVEPEVEIEGNLVSNGGFENGVDGYRTSQLDYTVVTKTYNFNKVHGGEQAVYVKAQKVGQQCNLYQNIAVTPNTNYEWRFWYKAESVDKNVMVGVRDNAGDNLMPSTITTDGDYLSSATASFTEKRTASSSLNWHQGLLATEWQEYVVTFNSGDQTAVWLTLNMWSTDRIGWTDDWSVEEAATGLEIDVVNGGFENGLDGYKTSTLKSEVITAQTGILQFTDTNGEAEKKGFTFCAPEDGIVYLVMNNTSGTVEIEDLILYSLLPEPAKPKVVTPNQGSGNAGASIWDEDFDFDFDWNTDQEDSIFDVVDDNDDDFDFGFDNVGDNDDDSVQTSQGKKYRQIRKRVLVSKGQPGISTLAIILICVGAVLIVGAGTFVIILFARKKRR